APDGGGPARPRARSPEDPLHGPLPRLRRPAALLRRGSEHARDARGRQAGGAIRRRRAHACRRDAAARHSRRGARPHPARAPASGLRAQPGAGIPRLVSVALRSVAGAERPSITAQGVWHRYGPGRGLEPVSFAWCGPSVAAVTGANGSGKSTLLKVLAGVGAPRGGTATLSIGGSLVPNRARRRCVGYASPDLMFYDELSCAENLAFAGEALGLRDVRRAFTAALDQVGLGRVAEDRPGSLSS